MTPGEWLESRPRLLTRSELEGMSAEAQRLRLLQNRTRVAYLQAQHERLYGIAAEHRLVLHMEVMAWTRER